MQFGEQNFRGSYEAGRENREEDYSKEFERKPFKADTEEKYTEEMFRVDQQLIRDWDDYEIKRFSWLLKKIG